MIFGGIELGGTKINMAVGDGAGRIIARHRIATVAPDECVAAIDEWFAQQKAIAALGVGAFGPISLDPAAPDYGHLRATNKPHWSGFDLLGALRAALDVPIAMNTDVAAAAVGEYHLGALKGAGSAIYLTVGTGIGGALLIDGEPVNGQMHAEMGHIPLVRAPGDDYPSTCRFHADCAEGLASGPAIAARFGKSLDHFPEGSDPHSLIADYVSQLCSILVFAMSPHRIVVGGGVAKTPGLHAAIRKALLRHMGGYVSDTEFGEDYLVAPALGDDAGLVGAVLLGSGPSNRS
jgi:fructokinase